MTVFLGIIVLLGSALVGFGAGRASRNGGRQ
jgi:hypothetical protein